MASELLEPARAWSQLPEADVFDLGPRAQVPPAQWLQQWSAHMQRWNTLLQIKAAVRIWRRRCLGGAATSQQILGSGLGGWE